MLIDFDYLFPKYNITPKGVLHVGAHEGQEAIYYAKYSPFMCFIEANYPVYNRLVDNIKKYPNAIAILECVGDEDGKEVIFKTTNNDGQSSSYLDFGTHSSMHPDVVFTDSKTLSTKTISTIYSENHFPDDAFDFLNIDIQGAELLALKGMRGLLAHFKWVYLEVNQDHVYKGGPLIGELDDYLDQFGFERVETKWCGQFSWGDALWIKK